MKNQFECEVTFKGHELFLIGNTCWGIEIDEAYLSGTDIDVISAISEEDYGLLIQMAIKELKPQSK